MKITAQHIGIVVGVIFVAAAGYWFLQNRSLSGVDALNSEQVAQLVKEVGEYAVLPEGLDMATVKVAAVQDAGKLRQASAFFKDAKNGDQLLMLPTKLILFRPSERKVVNMSAPAGLQENVATATEVATAQEKDEVTQIQTTNPLTEKITVEIRNGSGVTGLAGVYKISVPKDVTRANVSKTGNAANDAYATTVIVKNNIKNVSDIEKVFGVTASVTLPIGEIVSNADVLIILGKDAKK